MDYSKTKIYKIWSLKGDKIYVGATTKALLCQRMSKHRSNYKQWSNGKTNNTAAVLTKAKVDETRWVTVQFTTNVMPGLGWNFYPKQSSIKMHPGQIETVIFIAKNI